MNSVKDGPRWIIGLDYSSTATFFNPLVKLSLYSREVAVQKIEMQGSSATKMITFLKLCF